MQRISVSKNDIYPLLALAIPLVLTGTVQSTLSFFETVFLAQLGEHVLAAGALVGWFYATLIVILFGIFSSVNILVAHKHGAKTHTEIPLILRDGLILTVLLTIPTFIMMRYMASILLVFGQSPAIVQMAQPYFDALSWGVLPKFVMVVLFFEFLLGLGHTRAIMIFTFLSIPVYILLSYCLIFGKFGLPALGIAGAGWGMTLGDWLAALATLLYLIFHQEFKSYLAAMFTKKNPSYLKEILYLGVPMGAMYCFEVGFFFVLTLLMGTISVQALAANQIVMQYLGPLMGLIFSISQAITVRMGHEIGAKNYQAARRAGYAGIYTSLIFMSGVALCYWFIPKTLISVDFNVNAKANQLIVSVAVQLLTAAAFFQVLESVRIALFGALRALKDTRYTLLSSIVCWWGIGLPLGYLLTFHLHIGGQGLWWGIVAGSVLNVYLLNRRFMKKMVFFGTN